MDPGAVQDGTTCNDGKAKIIEKGLHDMVENMKSMCTVIVYLYIYIYINMYI